MIDVYISDTNPIPLVALVTGDPTTGYVVQVQYGAPPVTLGTITDTFAVLPATLELSVDSSTVPPGCSLRGVGGGTWTSTSASSLVATLPLTDAGTQRFEFTVLLVDGAGTHLARVDPRIIVKKLSM